MTVLEVAELVRDLIGEHVKISKVPARAGDFGGKDVSAEKAERELGWTAKVSFESGIKSTVEWFCQEWGYPMRGEVL